MYINSRKCLLYIGLVVLFLIIDHTPASAQSAGKIISNSAKALGGEKLLKKIESREARGRITDLADHKSGQFRASTQKPNLYSVEYDIGGLEVGYGFNGKSSWIRDSKDGLRTMTGQLSRDFQAEAIWRNHKWLDYKKFKSKIAYEKQTDLNGKRVNAVLLTTAQNVTIRVYFDAVIHLPVREEIPNGATPVVYDFSDYRKVNGILEPFTIMITTAEKSYEIELDEVAHNLKMDMSLFEFPRISNEPLPDIPALLQEVKANEDEVDRILEKYTYTETITEKKIDSKGQVLDKESETFELTFYKGNRIRKLVSKNGNPLSPNDEANEIKKIEKRVREIEKKEAKKEREQNGDKESSKEPDGNSDSERGRRISLADVLRASDLINPRRERFRGRDVIVFDFEPLENYKPQKDYEKFFGKMAGAIWIDAKDKQVARVEARLVEPYKIAGGLFVSLNKGATIVVEQNRVNNEIWLPTRADITLNVRVFLIKGINVNQTINYGNYKKFAVDSEKEKLKDPIKGNDGGQ